MKTLVAKMDNQMIELRHHFCYIAWYNQIKNILLLTFQYFSLSFIIPYIFTFKKQIVLFLQYNSEIYKITTHALGKEGSV